MNAAAAVSDSAALTEPAPSRRFAGLVSLARSLAINLLGPWLVYLALERAFPAPSRIPLWASAAIPALYLVWELWKDRRVDVPAVISLAQLSVSVAISLLALDLRQAMVGHAFQPAAQGIVFLASVLIGRPLMIPLARQAMCGDDPVKRARFDKAVATRPAARRSLAYVTLAWTAGLCAETAVRLSLVGRIPNATYLLVANVLSYVVPALLIWASLRYGQRAARQLREKGASAAPSSPGAAG